MDRYKGRVALVTGASSGIGAAIVQSLLKHDLVVVGLARRVDKVKALKEDGSPGTLHALKADVTVEDDILSAFKWIKNNLGGVDVLVNVAGLVSEHNLTEAETSEWQKVIYTNVLGLSICTREAVKSMRERGIDDGYIIHIGSIFGHIDTYTSGLAMYTASKHAVNALTEGLRKDLVDNKSKIRNTTISPGLVKTEVFDYHTTIKADDMYAHNPYMDSEDIADCVVFALSRPLRVQVHDIIVYPTGQNFESVSETLQ